MWGKRFATGRKPVGNHSKKPPDLCGGRDLKQDGNQKETSRKPLKETIRFVWGKRFETGRKPVGNQSETTPGNQPICVGEHIPTLNLALQKGSGNQSETSRKPLQETTRFVWGKGSGARSAHRLGFIIIKTKRRGGRRGGRGRFCAKEVSASISIILQVSSKGWL